MINILTLLYFLIIPLKSQEIEFKINKLDIPSPNKSIIISNIALFSNESDIASNIISRIDSAKKSIDIAIYSLTNTSISDSIIRAHNRGINVRMIIENSKINSSRIDPAVQKLIDANIAIKALRGGGLYGIMHNKIAIIDSSILITGSYNFTLTANSNNFENIVIVTDPQNIKSYNDYFEIMWEKAIDIKYNSKSLAIPSDIPETLFTIINTIRTNIIKLINYAQKSIDIAVYAISDEQIYQEILKAKNQGIKIRIVTDRLQSTQSDTVKKLYEAGIDVKISDGFNKGMMHNKYAIFDNSFVITGSFNWSNNAENYNWENAIILDKSYANYFSKNFETIYNQAKNYNEKENISENPSYNSR